MTYEVNDDFPSTTALDIWLLRTTVEQAHFRDGVEMQHHVWKYRRGFIVNEDWSKREGTLGAYTGHISTSLSYASAELYTIPVGSNLFTIDDHDADVVWLFKPHYAVTGGSGKGYVRITYGAAAATSEMSQSVGFDAWDAGSSSALTKNTIGNEISVNFKVDDAAATIELKGLSVLCAEQVTLGV